MNKTFIPTNRIKGNMEKVMDAGVFTKTRSRRWEYRPGNRRNSTEISMAYDKRRQDIIDDYRYSVTQKRTVSKVVNIRKVGKGFRLLANGPDVHANFQEAKGAALKLGYRRAIWLGKVISLN